MPEPAVGPQPLDWLIAALRGLHPIRWVLCLAGVVATLAAAAVLQSVYDGQPLDWVGWWSVPGEQSRTLGNDIATRSFAAAVFRIGPVLAAIGVVWCVLGAWIARHELLTRRTADPYSPPERIEPSPSQLVIDRAKSLVLCCPTVLILIGVFLLPMAIFALVNQTGGVGAILDALFLPLVLVSDLILLLLAIGSFAWPLMAVTIAAENTDVFDALSRSFTYAFTIRFILLMASTLAIAAIPLAIVLAPLADVIADWPPAVGQIVFWLAAALSMSVFWSLETLVYLHLRAVVDRADAREVAIDIEPAAPVEEPASAGAGSEEPAKAGTPTKAHVGVPASAGAGSEEPAKAGTPTWTTTRAGALPLLILAMAGTWWLTVWLFRQTGGEQTEWLNWGLADGFVPRADGLYKVASLIAGLWAVVWIAAPIVVSARRWLRGGSPATKAEA